jgi:hypothetical protein
VKAVKQKISGDIAKYHMGIIRWSKMLHTKDYMFITLQRLGLLSSDVVF